MNDTCEGMNFTYLTY